MSGTKDKFTDTSRNYSERFLSEEQAKQVVKLITELGLQPGANTETDCLCLTDDPVGGGLEGPDGSFDVWFIGWDPHRGKWVAANQKLDKDGKTTWQAAHWWDGDEWRYLPFIGW